MAEIGMISRWNYRKENSFSKRDFRKASMRNTRSEEKLGSAVSFQTRESCLLLRRISSPDIENLNERESFNSTKNTNLHGLRDCNFSETRPSSHGETPKVKIRVANIIKNPRFLLNPNHELRNQDLGVEFRIANRNTDDCEKDKNGTDINSKKQFLHFRQARKASKCAEASISPRSTRKDGKIFNRLYSSPTLGYIIERSVSQKRFESCDSSLISLKERNESKCKTKYRAVSRASSVISESDNSIENQDLTYGNFVQNGKSTTINLCRSVPWKFLYKSDSRTSHSDCGLEKILYSECPPTATQSEFEDAEIKRPRDVDSELSSKYYTTDSIGDRRNCRGNFDIDVAFEDLAETSRISSVIDTRSFSDSWAPVYKSFEGSFSRNKSSFSTISRDKSSSIDGHILAENLYDQNHTDSRLLEHVEFRKLESDDSGEAYILRSSPVSKKVELENIQFLKNDSFDLNNPYLMLNKSANENQELNESKNKRRLSINDLYDDFSVISTGRFSHICCCHGKAEGEIMAVKIIPKLFSGYLNLSNRKSDHLFSFLKSISHPNIVKVLRVFQDETCYYMVMEMCRGPTLLELFMGYLPGTMNEAQVKSIILQILLALDVLHSNNFAHGDIKLENVIFKNKLESDSFNRNESLEIPFPLLNLIDLDTIKDLNATNREINIEINNGDNFSEPHQIVQGSGFECDVMGTAPYMSPESHDGILCTASDMWSCGVLLYALFDGNFPFQLNDHLPLELRKEILLNQTPYFVPSIWSHNQSALDLCARLLDPNPRTRIQSAREALIHEWFSSETFEIFSHSYCN